MYVCMYVYAATLRTIALAHREINIGDKMDPESLESDLVLDAIFGNLRFFCTTNCF